MRCLFVVNQDTPLAELERKLRSIPGAAITVLSSQRLFASELAPLTIAAPAAQFLEFADLLTDHDNAVCDEAAATAAAEHGEGNLVLYARMLEAKNRLLHERLGNFDRIHYTDGLGVYGIYWRSVGGKSLPRTLRRRARNLWYGLHQAFSHRDKHDHLVVYAGRSVLFHGPVHRLEFEPGADVRVQKLPARDAAIAATRLSNGTAPLRATTMHFASAARASEADVLVCSDGYHPTNYPRSYLTGLAGRTLVPRDMFDRDWFRSHGLATRPPFPFLRREYMQRVSHERPVRKVLLALNHAGDWTAQVNRSDTDRLVEAFAACAREHPSLRFRVRPHPTMIHPRHEGIASIERIANFLAAFEVPVELSRITLQQDLADADLVVSEYSNVLIEAWKRGTLGIVANLSGRRDFMHSYSQLGFASVDTIAALSAAIASAATDQSFAVRQQAAADRYNQALDAFYAESREPAL
jgi:hypothetical protein